MTEVAAFNAPEVFTFPDTGQDVRTLLIDGDPWWVAKDVCDVLNLANPTRVLSGLDEDEKSQVSLALHTVKGGNDLVNIVNEPGLYSLILRSRKPEAKPFKRWITHEVIPAIRKTGSYALPVDLSDPLEALKAEHERAGKAIEMAEKQRARAELAETQVKALEPKADAWETLASAKGDYSVKQAADILVRDYGIDTGQNRLFRWLRENKMISETNQPYKRYGKYLVERMTSYSHPKNGDEILKSQLRVTAEGVRYLREKLTGNRGIVKK